MEDWVVKAMKEKDRLLIENITMKEILKEVRPLLFDRNNLLERIDKILKD
jgi:hypothetical protein